MQYPAEVPFGGGSARSEWILAVEEPRIVAVARYMYLVERVAMRNIARYLREHRVRGPHGLPLRLGHVFEMIHRGTSGWTDPAAAAQGCSVQASPAKA